MIIEGVATKIKDNRIFLVQFHDRQGKVCSGCGMCRTAPRGQWITLPENISVRNGDHVRLMFSASPGLSFAALLFPLATAVTGALLAHGYFPGEGWTLLGALLFFFAGFLPLRFLNRRIRKRARVEIMGEGRRNEEGY